MLRQGESDAARTASLVAVFHERYVAAMGNSGKLMVSASLTFDLLSSVLFANETLQAVENSRLGFKKRMDAHGSQDSACRVRPLKGPSHQARMIYPGLREPSELQGHVELLQLCSYRQTVP